MRIGFHLNGMPIEVEADPAEMTLGVLRGSLGLGSVRGTCGIGLCGTCTVVVDGKTTATCLMPIGALVGRQVVTIEGVAEDDPVVSAFVEANAMQCGFCIPAMVLSARKLLEETPRPSDGEIDLALAGNICRCGCYAKIRDAVHLAAARKDAA
jgi:aerobic-type carbon monoxide dehydrogenase small subunit (CoxS/CutS family)